MQIKLDSVLIGWALAGVVIILAVVSAGVGAASASSGGFGQFLALLAPPLGVGLLIIAATTVLKATLERRGAPGTTPAETSDGRAAERARTAASRTAETGSGRAAGRARAAAPNRAGGSAGSVASQGLGRLNVNLRFSIGNIGASVASVVAVVSVFIPWLAFAAGYGDVVETSEGFTLWEFASETELASPKVFFFLLLGLGVVGLASVVLPRWAGLVTGIVGMVMTLLTYIYIFAIVDEEVGELAGYGITVVTVPWIGFFLSGLSFLVVTVMRAIPGLNRPLDLGRDGD